MINIDNIFVKSNADMFSDILNLVNDVRPINKVRLTQAYKDKNSNLVELYARWTTSVDISPDFSVYDSEDYLNEAFDCWKKYSKNYLKLLNKYSVLAGSEIDVEEIHLILDLGCGIGLTTLGLKHIFPNADVLGTQLETSYQYTVASELFKDQGCFIIKESDTLNCGSVDLIFASEFFEHLQEPLVLLRNLIKTYRPKYFVIANTFTKMSLGHFNIYYDNGRPYSGKEMSKYFNTILRDFNYIQVKTGFFNNRPTVWKYSAKNSKRKLI